MQVTLDNHETTVFFKPNGKLKTQHVVMRRRNLRILNRNSFVQVPLRMCGIM